MKAALIVPRIVPDPARNLDTMERLATQACESGAEFLLFPEAVVTGLVNNDVPDHDIPLGRTIPGPVTARLGELCARRRVWLGFGMIEREGRRLYDAAVLLGPDGTIRLTYRRNQPHWHAASAAPEVYCQGTDLSKAETPFGSVGFLICGDVFDDAVCARFRDLHADWLLVLLARSGDGAAFDQRMWDNEEVPEYAARIRRIATKALIVNYLGDPSLVGDNSFGGAWRVSANGEFLDGLPVGMEGMLLVNLPIRAPHAQRGRSQLA